MIPRYLMLLALVLLAGCSTTGVHRNVGNDVQAQKATAEIPEQQLLDVWIELFEPGELPEDEDDARGLSPEIRQAEARYLPVQLRNTMEQTGYWGAVRVVPQGNVGAEVRVSGTILVSDGERLELNIRASDATGREWFNNHYEAEVNLQTHLDVENTEREVFQALFNTIANDLAVFRAGLSEQEVVTIRRVAGLRFAADLAPDVFSDYLQQDSKGRYSVVRLPAEDDPMLRRVNAIRERDYMLIDTLNGHFDNFYREMQLPYRQWRKTRTEEMVALRKLQREARNRKLIGAAAILGAIAIEALGGDSTRAATGSLRDVMLVGGAYAIKSGFDKDSETTIHSDAELGESFGSEARPLVVEVEGETHKLTGSAEVQYGKWRELLRQIYASETGLPVQSD